MGKVRKLRIHGIGKHGIGARKPHKVIAHGSRIRWKEERQTSTGTTSTTTTT